MMTLNSTAQRLTAAVACVLFVFMWFLYIAQQHRSSHHILLQPTDNKGLFVLSHLQANDTTTDVVHSNSQNSTHIQLVPRLPTWKPGTFCDKFIGHTFRQRIPVCGAEVLPNDSVVCLKNPDSHLMVRCSIYKLAIDPKELHKRFFNCEKCDLEDLNAAWLLDEGSCPSPTVSALDRTSEGGDYQRRIMHEIMKAPKKPSTVCQKWVDKTVFILTTHPYHIYFRFLGYFNLHKAILETVGNEFDFQILRLSDKKGYMFPEYEKRLFPELMTLMDLPNATVCFSKVVFVPWTYSATPFRCKMESYTKGPCLECNGRKLYGTAFMSFRKRVISACSLEDEAPEDRETRKARSLVVILRRPYNRWDGDYHANFQRVLANQDEVITALRQAFPSTNITTTYMEKMPICEQVRMVHSADVLMGVHGAGLVHSWWLQEDALLFELVPVAMINIPSFKTLTKLSGRRYASYTISSGIHRVTASPEAIVKKLREVSNLK